MCVYVHGCLQAVRVCVVCVSFIYMPIPLVFRANMESETRVENKRIVRRMQQESIEHAMEEKLQRAEREREYREKQKRQEEQLVKVHSVSPREGEYCECRLDSTQS